MNARESRRKLAIVLLVALAAGVGCGRDSRPSFLLVSIDTLRADHLGSYGYPRDTSPHLDELAARSVRYAEAFAPAPYTLPSHVGLLTGRHPYDVGIVDQDSSIPPDVPMLAERLQRAGWRTAAFVDSGKAGFVGGRRGFARGFDVYRHAPFGARSRWFYDMEKTVDVALSWLEQRRGEPYFLFVHTKAVHTAPAPDTSSGSQAPYDKPAEFRDRYLPGGRMRFDWRGDLSVGGVFYLRDLNTRIANGEIDARAVSAEQREELRALYDGGIRFADAQLGRLFAGLDRLGRLRDTVVILTADHGEAFGEHELFLHKEVHRELLHVPLVVHDPRGPKGRVIEERVSLMQAAGSILERAGLRGPGDPPALPLEAGGSGSDEPFFAYYRLEKDYEYEGYSVLDGRHRLVHHKLAHEPDFRTELFDVESDPAEQTPLASDSDRAAELLAWIRERLENGPGGDARIDLDPESTERLRALGYIE